MWSCTAQSWTDPGGDIVVLGVAGELDRLTCPLLSAALDAALDGAVSRVARHLVVDLAGVTFCCVRGFALLADTAAVGAVAGAGYAISGLPVHLQRHARMLWVDRAPIRRYRSAAAAVSAIRAEQAAGYLR